MTAEAQQSTGLGGAPLDRIDPKRSVCVLIGVPDYVHLPGLQSIQHNVRELHEVLTDRNVWGIADDRVEIVRSPTSNTALVEPIRRAAERAEDTLLVYYAGHGLLNKNEDELWLTMPHSEERKPDTCVRAEDVELAMRDYGSARRRVLVLDCCFSGQVVTTLSADDHAIKGRAVAVRTLRDVSGSYVMTSAPRDRPAHAPDKSRCTLFTGALVDAMREGVPDGPEMLGLHDLFREVKQRLAQHPSVPEPQDADHNGVGELGFVRNVAVLPLLPPPVPTVTSHNARAKRWSLLAGAAGLAIGMGVAPAQGWWERTFPDPAGGECSSRAVLLDHSDTLNKRHINYEKAEDLSGLALLSEDPVRALAVTDNNPTRLFPMRLGSPFDLNPSLRTATTLRRADGRKVAKWYDAEALVVEKGGRTVLVGSETGPAIRRFDLATGREKGKPIPVPEQLQTWPEGGGQTGRTIESLTVSPDGRYLYAGWEAPLAQDGDTRGSSILRIQRYRGSPGRAYVPDAQYAYLAGSGMYLTELVALGEGKLLALERQYVQGLGNAVRVVQLSFHDARDVRGVDSLHERPADVFADRKVLLDLAECPSGGPGAVDATETRQANPLLGNAEGMALGTAWTEGRYRGWRPLYLVTDDNASYKQITRLYSFALRL